ncbi:MAG: hypothetical protein AAF357_04495 [Verrucomicrobiota bacterium]
MTVKLATGNITSWCYFDIVGTIPRISALQYYFRECLCTLGEDASSGARCRFLNDREWSILLPGVKVGEGHVVGAGGVVTINVAPFTVVAGSPARQVGERNREITYVLNQ